MRIALVNFPSGDDKALRAIAEAMRGCLESKGHRLEILDPRSELARLASFDFIMVGAECSGFGKIPVRVKDSLKQAFGIAGKRSFAYLRAAGFMQDKALGRLMAAMEGEGLRVVWSELVKGPADAAVIAAQVPVERN